MVEVFELLKVLAIIAGALALILFFTWLLGYRFKSHDSPTKSFGEWTKTTLFPLSKMTKVILGIAFLYVIVFGFVIRLIFFPEMIAEHWLGLIVASWFTFNIFAYFNGWTLFFIYSESKPTDSKRHRFLALIFSAIVLSGALYGWVVNTT